MKKPDDKKSSTNPKPQPADKPAAAKKPAAKPGTVSVKDTGPGDGKAAAASGAKITAAESTLVGDGKGGKSAAAPKSETSKADTAKATPPTSAAAKAADGKGAGMRKGGADAKSAAAGAAVAGSASTAASGQAPKPSGEAAPKDKPADAAPKGSDKDAPSDAKLRETPASRPAPAQNVTVKKTGFWPVALGGVVAAGVGAAATLWALPNLPAGWLPEQAQPEVNIDVDAIRADAVSAAEAAAREQVDALRAELAEAAPADMAPAEAVPSEDAAAEPVAEAATDAPADTGAGTADQIAALQARLDEQAARIEALSSRPTIDPEAAQRVQSLADQAGALEQQIKAAAEAAQSEITEAQAEAQRLQDAAAESTRRAEAVAAVAALQSALDRGVTPDEARETLEGAGIDTPDALAREVPSLAALQEGFGEAARGALRATLREQSSSGDGNLLTNFLRAQTGARSVEPREGDDPDAVLSRANAEVEGGHIDAALNELSGLPETAREAPVMAEWLDGANAYREAQAALSDLTANSN